MLVAEWTTRKWCTKVEPRNMHGRLRGLIWVEERPFPQSFVPYGFDRSAKGWMLLVFT